MKITRDRRADAAYVSIGSSGEDYVPVAHTEEINDDLLLDYDSDGKIIGLDILNVRGEDSYSRFSLGIFLTLFSVLNLIAIGLAATSIAFFLQGNLLIGIGTLGPAIAALVGLIGIQYRVVINCLRN